MSCQKLTCHISAEVPARRCPRENKVQLLYSKKFSGSRFFLLYLVLCRTSICHPIGIFLYVLSPYSNIRTLYPFLPAAKPIGHRKVRIVVVVVGGGLLWGNDLEGKPKVRVNLWFALFPWSPTLNFLWGGIHIRINQERQSLTRFLFGVGSISGSIERTVVIDQIFLRGGIHIQINQERLSLTRFLFGVGSRASSFAHKGLYHHL